MKAKFDVEDDKFSKKGLQQGLGSWRIVEEINGDIHLWDQPPYIQFA